MNSNRFDAITRFLTERPSRRGLMRALTGGGLTALVGWPPGVTDVAAKSKGGKKGKKKKKSSAGATCTPTCGRKQCGDDGCGGSCGSCAAGQFCTSGTCCTPESPAVTCAGRCGTATSVKTCRQPVACSCPSGQECLSNDSCAIACQVENDCPAFCSCVFPSVDGPHHCAEPISSRTFVPQVCASTAECPVGQHCLVTSCGPGPLGSPENRCVPVCNS